MGQLVKHARTQFGEIAYTERGEGPAALFVHGVMLNGYLWRHVIDRVADRRRCIAIDLMAHGATRISADQDVSFTAQAEMLAALIEVALMVSRADDPAGALKSGRTALGELMDRLLAKATS